MKTARPIITTRKTAFTLVEVAASLVIMGILFATVLLAFDRSFNAVVTQSLRQRGIAVAQRRMELLLASRQEPNSLGLSGQDEFDPLFFWNLSLSREPIDMTSSSAGLAHTVIKAVVSVQCRSLTDTELNDLQLVRHFRDLKPIPGYDVAVPITPDDDSLEWYIDLRQRLGHEPTMEETLIELVRIGQVPAALLDTIEPLKQDYDLIDVEKEIQDAFKQVEQLEDQMRQSQ